MRDAVVSIRGHAFDRPDIVLVGFVDGSWPAFERSARDGLACDRDAGGRAAAEEVRAAAAAFRRSRGLLAADELEAWLVERDLSRAALTAYLRRRVHVEAHAGELDEIVARNPVSVDDVAGILVAEAACDGIMDRCATTAAEWAAVAEAAAADITVGSPEAAVALAARVGASAASRILDLGDEELAARIGRLLGLRAAFECWVTNVANEAATAACIDAHRMDWLRFDCVELRFDREDAAREGAMCLREDGLQADEVARMAGAALSSRSVVLAEADRALASLLVAAEPGDVVGPVPGDGGTSRLLVVTARVPPSNDDPALTGRARDELVAAGLEPLVAGMVRWHAPL